jgi:hypothetical protein
MVEGNFTEPKADSIGADEQPDDGLFERGKKLLDSVTSTLTLPLAVPVAAATAASEWLLPKPYTIDAETKILGPVLEPLAAVLGPVVSSVDPDLLLKDRSDLQADMKGGLSCSQSRIISPSAVQQ